MTEFEKIHVLKMHYDDDIVNSVFFVEKDTLVVVDTGVKEKKNLLVDEINRYGCKRVFVVITHHHYDHIGNNYELFKNFNPLFISHENSKMKLEDYEYQFNALERSVLKEYEISSKYKQAFFSHLDKEISIDISFIAGMNLHLGSQRTIRLVHLPGHTSGDLGLIDKNTDTMVLSELLFAHSRKILIFIENFEDYVQSLGKLKNIILEEGITSLITSHDEKVLTGEKNICDVIDYNLNYVIKLKSLVLDYHNQGFSVEKCAKSVCDRYDKQYSPGAIITVKAILANA